MSQACCLRRKLCIILCGLAFAISTLLIRPAKAVAAPTDSFASTETSVVELRRALIDDVLDAYSYFHCYQSASHDIKVFDPTYRTITYRNGYTRKFPDTPLYTIEKYPCPTDPTHYGLLKRFSCNYETY